MARTCIAYMIFLNIGFVLGCCRPQHVDHRAVGPADPANVHRLPAWQPSPRQPGEREA